MTPADALELMKLAHEGQVDKSGLPYWTHPVRVTELLTDAPDYVKVAALLHDTLEDTGLTPDELLEIGLDSRSLDIILLVTRREEETYAAFIQRITTSGNWWAIRVKLADNTDNLSRPLPPEMAGLHKRYLKARQALLLALGEHNENHS